MLEDAVEPSRAATTATVNDARIRPSNYAWIPNATCSTDARPVWTVDARPVWTVDAWPVWTVDAWLVWTVDAWLVWPTALRRLRTAANGNVRIVGLLPNANE